MGVVFAVAMVATSIVWVIRSDRVPVEGKLDSIGSPRGTPHESAPRETVDPKTPLWLRVGDFWTDDDLQGSSNE